MWQEKYSPTWPILDQTVGERKGKKGEKRERKEKDRVLRRETLPSL